MTGKNTSCKESLRELRLFTLEEAQGDLINLYNHLKGGCAKVGGQPLFPGGSDGTKDLKLCQQGFKFDMKNNFFSARAVRQWHRLPKEVVQCGVQGVALRWA